MKRRSLALVAVWLVSVWVPGPLAVADPRGIEAGDLDRGADPCNDFFQFANGAWRAKNPIPSYLDRWSRRWQAGDVTKDQLRAILDEAAARPGQPTGSTLQLIGDFYGACMDETAIAGKGVAPLEPWLRQIDGMKRSADLPRTLLALHDISVQAAFSVGGGPDLHDPKQVIAQVKAGGLGMPDRDYYLKPDARFREARERYRGHVTRMFELAGGRPAAARAAADTVLRFETRLAAASLDNVALRDPHARDHKMTFAALEKLAPHLGFAAYFDAAHIARGDVNVSEPRFVAEVDRQLAASSLADWKTYLKWQLLASAAPELAPPFVDESFAWTGKFLSGASESKPRWKRCVEATDELLGEALGKIYVERHFPPAAKARALELVKNLAQAMKETIEGLDWMTAATKERALAKLAAVRFKIGFPDVWKDYSSIPIARGAHWDNVVAARRWNVSDERAQIGKPTDPNRWGMTPPTSDASYSDERNEIVFPAGILQPPAFSMDFADAVNYGAAGVVIGHEFSHGFDDQGAKFDAEGRLDNWWTEADLKQFQTRGQCVVDQFEAYEIEPGLHHRGRLVLGESIADLAGLKLAYRAFQIAQRGRPPAPTLDGFTPDQQFFIAWGQFRGDETRPEKQRSMVQGDPHPVARFRVIGPVSNFPPFAKAFQCRAGAPMVRPPEKRCEVW